MKQCALIHTHTQHAVCVCACKCVCVSTGGVLLYKYQILFYPLHNKAFAVLEMHLFHHRDKHHVKPTTVPCRNIIMTEVLATCTETTTINYWLTNEEPKQDYQRNLFWSDFSAGGVYHPDSAAPP